MRTRYSESYGDIRYPGWAGRTAMMGWILLVIAGVWAVLLVGFLKVFGVPFPGGLVLLPCALPHIGMVVAGSRLLRHDPRLLSSLAPLLWISYLVGLLLAVGFLYFNFMLFVSAMFSGGLPDRYESIAKPTAWFSAGFIVLFPVLIVVYSRYLQRVKAYSVAA